MEYVIGLRGLKGALGAIATAVAASFIAGIAFAFLMMGRNAVIFANAILRGESDARGLLIYVCAEAAISGLIASFPLAFLLWGVLELMLRFGRRAYSRALRWSVSLGLIFSCAIALLPFTLGRHERPTPRDIFWISTFRAVAPLCASVFWLCAQPEQRVASLASSDRVTPQNEMMTLRET